MEKLLAKMYLPLFVIAAACAGGKSEIIIGINEPIRHDDFEYVVTHYSTAEKIGEGDNSIPAKGKFYIVHFKVINDAKRVNHKWNNSIAYVKDEEGNVFENQKDAQLLLNQLTPMGWQEEYNTTPLSEDSITLIFDLPLQATHPYLMVRGETLMGDFFDGGKYEKTKMKLFE